MNLAETRGLSIGGRYSGESFLFNGKIPTSICLVSSSSFDGGCKIPRSICLISSSCSSVLGGGELLTRTVLTTKTGGGVGSTIGWLG